MAEAGRDDPDEDLIALRTLDLDLLEDERLVVGGQHGRGCRRHASSPLRGARRGRRTRPGRARRGSGSRRARSRGPRTAHRGARSPGRPGGASGRRCGATATARRPSACAGAARSARSAVASSSCAARQSARAIASSIVWLAPWPWWGTMACAASPIRTTRSVCQRCERREVVQRPARPDVGRADHLGDGGVPAGERVDGVADRARLHPRLVRSTPATRTTARKLTVRPPSIA